MEAYLAEVRKMEKRFMGMELQHVPRRTNKIADDIAKRASQRLPQEPGCLRSGSSGHQLHHHFQARLSLGRSSPSLQPREPQPVARPQEHACSWRWSLRKDAGLRSSRIT